MEAASSSSSRPAQCANGCVKSPQEVEELSWPLINSADTAASLDNGRASQFVEAPPLGTFTCQLQFTSLVRLSSSWRRYFFIIYLFGRNW